MIILTPAKHVVDGADGQFVSCGIDNQLEATDMATVPREWVRLFFVGGMMNL